MDSTTRLRVYTDGACAFCWWARGLVQPYDSEQRLDFRDFNDPAVASQTPYSRAELLREMHVLTPDGRWHSGFAGWVEILRVLPRRRWLAKVLAVPLIRWIGALAYKIAAANRYRLPRWFLRLLGAPQPCAKACEIPPQAETPRTL